MADLKQRIQAIKPFFREMQVVPDEGTSVVYVSVFFPNRWIIADDIEKKFNVTVAKDNVEQSKYYFCADIEVGFDSVFDAIDYNINKMKSAQERAQLLQQKVAELRELFENEDISLEVLRTIDFSHYVYIGASNSVDKDEEETVDDEKSMDFQEEGGKKGGSLLTNITSGRKKKIKDNTETK